MIGSPTLLDSPVVLDSPAVLHRSGDVVPGAVVAHAPPVVAWTLVAGAAAVGALAVLGLRNRSRVVRTARRAVTDRWAAVAVLTAAAALAVATSPPFERLADGTFSVHMVQHLLLVSLVAPLLAFARPGPLLLAGAGLRPSDLPATVRRPSFRRWHRLVGCAAAAVVAAVVMSAVLWAWHAPVLFDAAVRSPLVHGVEHLTMLASAIWFWVAVASRRTPMFAALFALLVAAVMHGALGGLITFAPRPLYSPDSVSGLSDQQLAGLLMWIPGGAVHLVVGFFLVVVALRGAERRAGLRSRALVRAPEVPA